MRLLFLLILFISIVLEAGAQEQTPHKLLNCAISGCHKKLQETVIICDSVSGLIIKNIIITSGSSYDINGFAPKRKKSIQYVYDAYQVLLLKGISITKQRGDVTIARKSNFMSLDPDHNGFKVMRSSFLSGNRFVLKYNVYGRRVSKEKL